VKRNAGLLFVSRLASATTTLIVLAAIGHLRGPEALGRVAIGFAIGAIAAAVSDLGLASLVVREAARAPTRGGAILGVALTFRLVSIPVCLALAGIVAAVGFPTAAVDIGLVVAGLVAQQTAEQTRALLIAAERMDVHAAHAVTENVIWAVAICAPLAAGLDLTACLVAGLLVMVASVVAGLALDAVVVHAVPRRPSVADLRAMLPMVAPFAAFNIVGSGYSRIDTVLVGLLLPGVAVASAGLYFAAARLVAAFEYLPEAVSRALYPELARRGASGAPVLGVLRPAADRLLIVGLLVPGVLLVGAGWLMPVVFGEAVGADAWLVGGLALAVPLRFLGYLYGTTLTSSDAQSRRVLAAAVAFVVVVGIDALLIPLIGVAGAVVGSVAGSVVVVSVYGWSVARRVAAIPVDIPTAVLAIAAVIVATLAGFLVGGVAGNLGAMITTTLVYIGALAITPARSLLLPGRSARATS